MGMKQGTGGEGRNGQNSQGLVWHIHRCKRRKFRKRIDGLHGKAVSGGFSIRVEKSQAHSARVEKE